MLSETSFWDELQQKECRIVDEFYRKGHKYLKLEDSKEALCKPERTTTGKKSDPRARVKGQKRQDKRRREDKWARSPMKWKYGPLEKKKKGYSRSI